MKTIYKVLISFIIGLCLIFAGISLGGMNQLYQFSWFDDFHVKWNAHSIHDIHFESDLTKDRIKINTSIAQVNMIEQNVDHIRIDASNLYNGFEIYEEGNQIVIHQPHYWWRNANSYQAQIHIIVPINFEFQKIELNSSAGSTICHDFKAHSIDIDNSMGELIMNRVICESMEIDGGMSQTTINQLSCNSHLDAEVGMGAIDIDLYGHKSDYNYNVDVGMGSVQIGNEKFSGIAEKRTSSNHTNKSIDIDCGMGSIDIRMEE